jgi:hypothetical protein
MRRGLIHQHDVPEEIRRKLNSGQNCRYLVWNLCIPTCYLQKCMLKYADPYSFQLFDIGANFGLSQQEKNVD